MNDGHHRILLIFSENWTLTGGQDLPRLADWAAMAERAGVWGVMLSEHICLGPSAGAKGRESNQRAYMAPLLRRLIEYGDGFHPFGPPSSEDLRRLPAGLESAGRDFASFPKIGGIRARFTSDQAPAKLADSMPSIIPQMEAGYDTFCVKPNQFIDDADAMEDFLDELVASFKSLQSAA